MAELFVNREPELGRLADFRRRVVSGRGGIVVVEGTAGIGKTAVLRAFRESEASATPRGHTCRLAASRCHGQVGEGDAYGPLVAVLAQLKRPRGMRLRRASSIAVRAAPDLLTLVPEVGPALRAATQVAKAAIEVGSAAGGSLLPYRQSVTQAVSAALGGIAKPGNPVLVVIDDVHMIDPSSCAVLDHLADEIDERHLGLVLAVTSEGMLVRPDLQGLFDRWESAGVMERIPLAGLAEPAVEALVARMLEGAASHPTTGELLHLTAGHPLFLTQYLRFLEETGATRAPAVPSSFLPTVRGVIRRRLENLDVETRELLVAAATQGETFMTAVVEQLTDLPRLDVLNRLHRVSRETGLIRLAGRSDWAAATSSDHYRFEHGLLQLTLYDLQSGTVARERHARIADVQSALIAAHPGAPLELQLDVGRHLHLGGRRSDAAAWNLRIAQDLAVNGMSFAEAEALCLAALDDLQRLPPTSPDRDRQLAEAIELILIMTEVHWRARGQEPDGRDLDALARTAHEAAERHGDPRLTARMVMMRGKVAIHTRNLAEALTLLQEAVDLARASGDSTTLYVALVELGRQLPKRDLAGGLRILQEAEDLFASSPELTGSQNPVVLHACNLADMQLGVNHFDAGDLGEADRRLSRCLGRLRKEVLRAELPIALNYFAQLKVALGRWDAAAAALEEALAFEEQRGGPSGWHAYNTALLALVRSRGGDRDRWRKMVEEAWQETEQTWLVNLVPLVRNFYAQLLVDMADDDVEWLDAADDLALASVVETRGTGMVRSEVAALALRCQVALRRGDPVAAAEFGREAVAILDRFGNLPALRTEEVLLHAAEAIRAAGEPGEARGLLERAVMEVRRKAASLQDDAARSSFLADVPVNAAIATALARPD